MKIKLKKMFNLFLTVIMTFSLIQVTSIKNVNAASLANEATMSITGSSFSVDLSSAGINKTGTMYNMKMNGSTAFCMDAGLRANSGIVYARSSTKTGTIYNRIWNYFLKDDLINSYLQSSPGTWSTNNRAAAQAMYWAYEEGVSNANAAKALKKVIAEVWTGISAAPDWTLEEWVDNARNYSDSSGTLYVYNSGKSGYQRILSGTLGVQPVVITDDVSSTQSYSTTENIKVQVNKNDVETANKLSGVSFDFYKDNVKGGSAITNTNGVAEHTFTTTFSKSASATKEYCSNYSKLSIPNQEIVKKNYEFISQAAAQAAADAEALAEAKRLALIGSGEEHSYKVIETGTKTNYWLNLATNTYEKKLTGAGTVTFDVSNMRQKGSITITKRDSETNNLVDQAIYGLYARSNIVHPDGTTGTLYTKDQLVATFPATALDGTAKLSGLYLGQYYIKEITAPSGYLHSSDVYNVDLNYAGQNVEITDSSATVKDKVQRAKVTIVKKDKELNNGTKDPNIFDFNKDGSQGDSTRVGATYGIFAREDIIHADGAEGVVTYNQVAGSIHELKAVKGTDLSVKNVQARAGTLLATIKTDSNAEFGFDHLYNGKYFIKEITGSEGYLTDPTEYDFNLSYTNQNELVVTKSGTVLEQVKKQGFDLFKAGHVPGTSANAKPLANVEFTVWLESDLQSFIRQGKTLVEAKALAPIYDKLVTKVDGTASSSELPYGKYRVAETKAAVDYATADDFFVTVTEDNRTHQSFTNNVIIDELFTGLIEAVKLDKETGKQVRLEGAEFKIKNLHKNEYIGYWEWLPIPRYIDSWKTNDQGYVRLQEKMEAGNYQLEEIHAPSGYVLDTTPIPFKITNQVMYEIAEDGKTPIIKTYKSDISTKGKIQIEKQGEVLTKYDTDTKQFIYELKGLKDAEYDIFAKEDILDPSNDKTVLYAKDKLVTSIKTGEDGKAISKELPLGSYYSKEKTAPSGYVLSNEIKEFTLEYEDETVAIVYDQDTYINDRQKVSVETSKQDAETQEYVAGAEITLKANRDIYNYAGDKILDEGTILETVTTDQNGKATFTVDLPNDLTPEYATMPIGDEFNDIDPDFNNNVVNGVKLIGDPNSLFVIYESKAPDGYIPFAVNYYVDTKYTNQDEPILKFETPFENEKTTTNFKKTDVANEEIEGAELTLKDADGKVVDSWISTKDEHIVRGLIFNNQYTLEENYAPSGYVLSQPITFTFDKNMKEVSMIDIQFEISKLDVESKFVEGAKLQVINEKTKQIVDSWTSTGEKHYVSNLIAGEKYVLQELEAPKEYSKANDISFIVNTSPDENQSLEMTDKQVDVTKIDKVTQKILPGAKLQVINAKTKEVVDSWTSTGEKHYVSNLVDGNDYILQEVEAPKGYDKEKDIPFTVIAGENQSIIMGDDTYVNIYKVDSISNELVSNAKLQIIDKETKEVVKEFTSNGKVEHITGLTPGNVYIIHEVEQPEGYYINKEDIEFTVGQDIEVYFTNNPILTDIQANKIDSVTKKPVLSADFEFTLYADPKCTQIIAVVHANIVDGTATFKDVRYGVWYIKETAAPIGYKLSDEVKKVIVNDSLEGVGDIYSFMYENTLLPVVVIPTTQDTTTIACVSALCILSFLGIVIGSKKKKKEND